MNKIYACFAFLLLVQTAFSACSAGNFMFTNNPSEVCLPDACLQEFVDLNSSNYEVTTPTINTGAYYTYDSATGKFTIAYKIQAKAGLSTTPNDPTTACFDLNFIKTVDSSVINSVQPAAPTEFSFELDLNVVSTQCTQVGSTTVYDCAYTSHYYVKGTIDRSVFKIDFTFKIDIPNQAEATVTAFTIDGNSLADSTAGTHTFVIAATATQTDNTYGAAAGATAVGELVYVHFTLGDSFLAKAYKLTFKSAEFFDDNGLLIPITAADETTSVGEADTAVASELKLGFKSKIPGTYKLKVICNVLYKVRRMLQQNNTQRLAEAVVDVNVLETKPNTDLNTNNNGSQGSQESDEGISGTTIALIVVGAILAIVIPSAIGYGVYRYNTAKQQRYYEEQMQQSQKSAGDCNSDKSDALQIQI